MESRGTGPIDSHSLDTTNPTLCNVVNKVCPSLLDFLFSGDGDPTQDFTLGWVRALLPTFIPDSCFTFAG